MKTDVRNGGENTMENRKGHQMDVSCRNDSIDSLYAMGSWQSFIL